MQTPSFVLSSALVFSLALGGCAAVGTPMNDSAVPLQSADFMGQTQLPAGTKILYDQSLIIGSGDNWVGRVLLDMGKDSMAAYTFFLEQYPQQGWTLLSFRAIPATGLDLVKRHPRQNQPFGFYQARPQRHGRNA
ncbi:MAG: hypothetical protein RLZZ454_1845 [Pseudomonadota bacterium]